MTIHYHGTPITPRLAFDQLVGRHFCVSFMRPDQVARCHEIGQSVMLDNGAFTAWRAGTEIDWERYYAFCDRWLGYPTTWAVIPDVIVGDAEVQDALLAQWPFGHRGAPVWHMHEPIERLIRLAGEWPRVCIGSSSDYRSVMSAVWKARMDESWDALAKRGRLLPWIHMLRGMRTVGNRWPFASVDSTDIARNHSRAHNSPVEMANRWDAIQCPGVWAVEEPWALAARQQIRRRSRRNPAQLVLQEI